MARLAFEHGLQLHFDSIRLWDERSYGSALALSVLALEEIGKYFMVEDLVWRSVTEAGSTTDEQREHLQYTFDHRAKQGNFARQAWGSIPDKMLHHIDAGGLERDKQRAFYVGLPGRGTTLDLSARVIAPQYTGRRKAARQITVVSDLLLVFMVGGAYEYVQVETPEVQDMFTLRNARTLRAWWPHIGRRAWVYVSKIRADILRRPKKGSRRRSR